MYSYVFVQIRFAFDSADLHHFCGQSLGEIKTHGPGGMCLAAQAN